MKSNLIGAGALQNCKQGTDIDGMIATLFREGYVQFIADSMFDLGVAFRKRFYTPFNTLWIFIGQILSSDHSCREGVSAFITKLFNQKIPTCSYSTGAYCTARKRLPTELIRRLFRKNVENIIEASKERRKHHRSR